VPRRTVERPFEPREPVEMVHGLRAGLAVFTRRRDDIVRIAYAAQRELAELTRWAAAHRVPCIQMRDAELDRLAESSHHEGLCVVARPRRWLSTSDLGDVLARGSGAGLALDRVRNPYNVGAMMRTAAFFGLDAALLGAPAPHPGLAPTAVRVAEGGVEHVKLARTTDLAETLARLRARGVRVVGADARATEGDGGFAVARPVLLVVGNEREGLGDRVRSECDALVAVRGSGAIESLNVAVAAGVLLAAWARVREARR
jgi:TrmH RNA methyltransferase